VLSFRHSAGQPDIAIATTMSAQTPLSPLVEQEDTLAEEEPSVDLAKSLGRDGHE
jgi:hypothetical protein